MSVYRQQQPSRPAVPDALVSPEDWRRMADALSWARGGGASVSFPAPGHVVVCLLGADDYECQWVWTNLLEDRVPVSMLVEVIGDPAVTLEGRR